METESYNVSTRLKVPSHGLSRRSESRTKNSIQVREKEKGG